MASGLTLHIGTPKSGTTHLQSVLRGRRRRLAEVGVRYPGADTLPHRGLNQQPAVYGLGARHIDWIHGDRRRFEHYLQAVVDEVRGTRHRALLSAEALVCLDDDEVRTFLSLFGVPARQVRVVVTARDLARLLPSIWQQQIKSGAIESLDGYVEAITGTRDEGDASAFWRVYAVPGIVRRWARIVGMEQITVVTVPAPGEPSTTLWRRFALAVGIPADDGTPLPPRSPMDDNRSLSAEQAELLRAVNKLMRDQSVEPARQRRIREQIRTSWQGGSHTASTPIRLTEQTLATVAEWSAQDVDDLRALGVHVIAGVDDLLAHDCAQREDSTPSYSAAMAQDVLSLVHLPEMPPGGRRRLQTLLKAR